MTERVLENKVARSFVEDLLTVPYDLMLWTVNRQWPSKLALLQTMQDSYPDVFNDEEEVVVSMSRAKLNELVALSTKGKAHPGDGDKIFDHYKRLPVLLLFPGDQPNSPEDADMRKQRFDARDSPQTNGIMGVIFNGGNTEKRRQSSSWRVR